VLISAGGTRERLDAVRFIGNYSSGAMGVALAEVARDRGAQVTLVHAALEVPLPLGVECVPALSASQLREELVSRVDTADWVVLAAAVADYSPAQVETGKIPKAQAGEHYSPELVQTPDIAAEIGRTKPSGQKLVTFSAETSEGDDDLIARARQKGADKGADVVVANRVGDGLGFGQTETAVWIIQRSGAPVLSTGSKQTVAGHLFDVLPNV
jgi:phosphopantothenoylcysteine decarboxylase/phosphopantothenate--cysteine ligase